MSNDYPSLLKLTEQPVLHALAQAWVFTVEPNPSKPQSSSTKAGLVYEPQATLAPLKLGTAHRHAPGPNGFGDTVTSGNTRIFGRDRNGDIFGI